ncbi:glucodextranase DOMON-like domain-containing protein [Microbacterium dextranolyticum]|uniref:Dextranase n=1 Tax=Microbacterium dextranolyticum TaxID=36806 RepID=A0A9W6M5N4_9MICO|nr:glucodextranase DOMON-like domain-containing protein [Microbacterium dextranolyticum]MBM7463900.1 hypothetical protein [Microbacterium dextranolyticum]GLJ94982.1 hypothetical protein GCM10017591_10440 [Microbacterium dextranolyticum]
MSGTRITLVGMAIAVAIVGSALSPGASASAAPGGSGAVAPLAPRAALGQTVSGPVDSDALTTWDHANATATTGPVGGDVVRRSPYYSAAVATASDESAAHRSFVYMNVPRNGNGKVGYSGQDGAEFAADNDLSMSWTSFEYAQDVWVTVTLETSQPITSADDVIIRPSSLSWEKQVVDSSSIRVKVPYSPQGYRFSVEFAPQQMKVYSAAADGALTTSAQGNRFVEEEPRNAMLVFANPKLTTDERTRTVPTEADGTIYRPQPGPVTNLDSIDADIVYFAPGTYYMGSGYRASLPNRVRWIYIAPGAYVKGAFSFPGSDSVSQYKVTGRGVLSGEQYVYEADTTQPGYTHSTGSNCHGSCVKMLQLSASPYTNQTLDLEGVTVNAPPYHSFVVYSFQNGVEVEPQNFRMDVSNYKQVGSWYWQTDGIELYPHGTMRDTFFHANDDVLKLYHSDLDIRRTVIWKNENGPVFQWGWGPRSIDGVSVSDTDVIHNRMGWNDVKFNTCVFNSSSAWQDMGSTSYADPGQTVKNMTFTGTRVEGAVNCGLRVFAQSNTENIRIDGFAVDAWNQLDPPAQASTFVAHANASGQKVQLGDEMTDRRGLLLHDYTVGGVPVVKAGSSANWGVGQLGRLAFGADVDANWNATATPPSPPQLTVDTPTDASVLTSRSIVVSGRTNAPAVAVHIDGVSSVAVVSGGVFRASVVVPVGRHSVEVVATGASGLTSRVQRSVVAFGDLVGSLSDPAGDDHGPGGYAYPSDAAFNPGSLDLTGLGVYRDGDVVRFVVSTAGQIQNPWGGQGMSTQRVNIYLQDGSSSTVTALLPGTNTFARGAWSRAIVADGRFADTPFGAGVFNASGARVSSVQWDVDPAGAIEVSVPVSALGGIDLGSVGYQVSMLSSTEPGEGVGNVRPVYSAACGAGVGCPGFVGQYRGSGGAGQFTDAVASRDTDTTDSNAFDLITGNEDQSVVMDWTHGPVIAPYLPLDTARR